MNEITLEFKLAYITGLREVVLHELNQQQTLHVIREDEDVVYLAYAAELFSLIRNLRSITRAYISVRSEKFHPYYISHHKSIVGNLVEFVLKESGEKFKSFRIHCAGSDSPEVRSIAEYIETTFKISEKEDADLKIHIIKPEDMWEVAVQITPRPLSVRPYKIKNMKGAMDPTVAYAVNSYARLESARSYLNVFSGSGTLLIEAALAYPSLEKILGFDNNKEHLSLSIQNIKEAGLIRRVQVKECDIYDATDFGTIDAITADVPFGMSISKGEDLEKLYNVFVEYCEKVLKPGGRLVVYTSEYELLEKIISNSKFNIIKTLALQTVSNVDAYLKTKILVCEV